MRKILYNRDSPEIQPLKKLIQTQTHKTLVLWALDIAKEYADLYTQDYPNDPRVKDLLPIAKKWYQGQIKMPQAKQAILQTHQAAKETQNPYAQAAARAVGHAAATIHVETHALGVIFYGLTALTYKYNDPNLITQKLQDYCNLLLYYQDHTNTLNTQWSKHLQDESKPNKELLLHQKTTNQID